MTVKEIIELALEENGIIAEGEEAPAEMIVTNVKRFNAMIGEWSADIGAIPAIARESFDLPETQVVTFYSGGDLDSAYPVSILGITITDESGTRHEIKSKAEKDVRYVPEVLSGVMPRAYAFLPNNDEPGIIFDTIPPADCSISIRSLKPISAFDELTEEIDFPAGYVSALYLGLAVRLAPKYGKSPRPDVVAMAERAYTQIVRLNNLARKPGELRTDHVPSARRVTANIDYLP